MREQVLRAYHAEELPLYISPQETSLITGISRHDIMADLKRSINPLPHIKRGNRYRVRTQAIADYYQTHHERTTL